MQMLIDEYLQKQEGGKGGNGKNGYILLSLLDLKSLLVFQGH